MAKIYSETIVILLFYCFASGFSQVYNYPIGRGRISINAGVNKDNQAFYAIVKDGKPIQQVNLGEEYERHFRVSKIPNGLRLSGFDGPPVKIQLMEDSISFSLINVTRSAARGTIIRDCIDLQSNDRSWFGGPQQKAQYWPVDKGTFNRYSYVSKEEDNCGVAERYWLNSHGIFFYVHEEAPLFIDQNIDGNYLCLVGQKELPYNTHSDPYTFHYYIGIGPNPRASHMKAIERFLHKPTGHPDRRMVQHPIWSTWAKYKREIDEETVLKFADEILANNFDNAQFEIDDDWEICYGALEFRTSKFPDIKALVDTLKGKGFAVTLWVHPFINKVCDPYYTEAKENGYLVENHEGNSDTQWWNSGPNEAAYIDFTKVEAAKWFVDRLKTLQLATGIDSFKFDAGETSWSPADPVLNATNEKHPLAITTDYVNTVAEFGSLVEVRSGQNNQRKPIFMRIIDKDSLWSYSNGLPTLVTTTLTLNMVGYPMVLPDMIGGNGYDGAGGPPDKELFIRWLQANVFMPSLQYSYVPWDYDSETIAISHTFTDLHAQYSDEIMKRFELAVLTGEPVNPPLWWIAPDDRTAHQIADQFLLGEDIIAAPVLGKGETSRHIYLPAGRWIDKSNEKLYIGPKWLMDYPAPLAVLPYFVRENSNLF